MFSCALTLQCFASDSSAWDGSPHEFLTRITCLRRKRKRREKKTRKIKTKRREKQNRMKEKLKDMTETKTRINVKKTKINVTKKMIKTMIVQIYLNIAVTPAVIMRRR